MRTELRPGPYVFTMHETPPSLNEWRTWHPMKQLREKQRWEKDIRFLLHEKGNVCPHFERVVIRAVLFFSLERRRDTDNFTAVLAKWVQDALVKGGVLPDDNSTRCTFAPVGIVAGKRPMTIITIEDVREVAA